MFGDSSVVLLTEQERQNKQFIEVLNADKKSKMHKIEFDQKHGQVRLYAKFDPAKKQAPVFHSTIVGRTKTPYFSPEK